MVKKIFGVCLGLILAGMAAATWALAQPGPTEGFGAGGDFQNRFREVKRAQMGPALGVSQQTVDQILAIEQRYQPVRQQLIQSMKADYRRLEQVMSMPSPPEQEVRAVLGDMKRKKQQMQDLQTRQGEEEDALLTPMQQARYLMYLRSLLQEARGIKRGPVGPGGPGGPGETGPMTPGTPREVPVVRPIR